MPNFSSVHPHISPNNTLLCPKDFQGTSQQWHLLTTAPLLIGSVTIICGLTNVAVFRNWKSKPAFVYLYLSLSICEVLYALAYIPGGLARIFDLRHVQRWIFYATFAASYFFPRLADLHFICISFDRWLAVDFPIFYRNKVNPKSSWYAIGALWTYSVIVGITVTSYYSDKYSVPCSGPTGIKRSSWSLMISGGTEFFLTCIVVLATQSRMVYVAIRAKIKIRRNLTAVQQKNALASEVSLLQIVAKSVVGGYAMVFATVLCQIFSQLAGLFHVEKSYAAGYLLLYIEHVIPMFIYLKFHREYQKILYGLLERYGSRFRKARKTRVAPI